ncbi:MAG: PAC2 family protein [Bifidobacterium minimum]|jgi:hypothetical protein|uniref:PAC2 family protein n=1 Tax=Bifidobacterium minimum TaxID=1693 RepID=UPI0003B4940B|nr:PAC2 family protein [Bifidobacterium minimum]MCH4159336.1 PAC2 family protein [Bifidobacterium minimum]
MGCTERRSGATLIVAFEGWNDACQTATNVVRRMVAHYESREVRHISCDGYYDYQTARPMMCHVTGRARIVWPQTTFFEVALDDGYRLYAQIAPEPNYRWMEYCRQSLRVAQELDVDHVVTLGAMFAECPHTRPLPVDVSDSTCQCDMDREYNGPVGITTVLDEMARGEGFDTSSMWVSIPQYVGSDECAQGTLQLTQELSCVVGRELDTTDLDRLAHQWRMRGDVLSSSDDELAAYVRRLENEYDRTARAATLAARNSPQAEEMVRDAENYLKGLDH